MPNSEKYVELSSKFFKGALSLYSHPTNPKISALQKVEQLDMYKGGCGVYIVFSSYLNVFNLL